MIYDYLYRKLPQISKEKLLGLISLARWLDIRNQVTEQFLNEGRESIIIKEKIDDFYCIKINNFSSKRHIMVFVTHKIDVSTYMAC